MSTSSNRLSKLSQYLIDGNYQQAIQLYDRRIQNPSNDQQCLLLAKAYYINQNYQKTIQILKQIQKGKKFKINYQTKMLYIKAKYLNNQINDKDIQIFQNFIHQNKNNLNQYHSWSINQIKNILQKKMTIKKSNFVTKQALKQQKQQFIKLYQKYDDYSPIMQGMPVYLISSKWFQQWQRYITDNKVSGQNPGPITNFQIIDHIQNGFFDPRKHKFYTNNYLFEPCKFKTIPKQCWQFLFKRYGGNQIVRYNISTVSGSSQIITQTYLKRISLIHKQNLIKSSNAINQKDLVKIVQITKKQNWKGLIQNKLQPIWGKNGTIGEKYGNQIKKIDLNQFLQDSDTLGKIYIYIPSEKQNNQKKESVKSTITQKCAFKQCGKTKSLKFCQCKVVKYCNMECLKHDRNNHRKRCDLELNHLKQKSAIIGNFNLNQKKQYAGRKGLVGLRNLGNTCYMNSGLQCLSNTKQITDYFMSNDFLKDINSSNPLGSKGNLACAYAQLIRQVWTGNDEVISPFNLKKMIGKFAPQFSGFGQQDSQEFISYLIDGLQQDLNLVHKKQTFETKDQIRPDQQASLQSQRNYAKRIQSYIRDLMVGQFKSTVKCLSCDKISICFDPFLLISLPIPVPKQTCCFLIDTDLSHGAIKLIFDITDATTLKQLQQQIRKNYQNLQNLIFVKLQIQNFQIVNIIEDLNTPIKNLQKNNQHLFVYQVPHKSNSYQTYFVQYYYQNQRCGFSRLINVPKNVTQNKFKSIIQQSYKRSSSHGSKSFDQIIAKSQNKRPNPLYYKICQRYLVLHLKKQLKLLTFKENKDFTLSKYSNKRISLYDCLSSYSNPQLLEKDNAWYCNKCKQFQKAQKQLQIYKSNQILVLAFKRFSRFRKIKGTVDFPLQGLDMGPFLKSNKQKSSVLYDLYGVVNHYGTLGGGHYTAYCQNFINKRWYQFNDSRVSQISKKQIVSESSYVLFFRKRD